MSAWTDMGAGVHCAPSGVLYIDGRPYEMVGVPRFTSMSEGVDQFEMTVVPKEFSVSFTIERPSHAVVWPGGKPPAWLQAEAYEHAHAFASELSESSGIPLEECVQAVLNAMSPRKSQPPKVNTIMKPNAAPPMWVRDPAKTRRTAYGPTRRVK